MIKLVVSSFRSLQIEKLKRVWASIIIAVFVSLAIEFVVVSITKAEDTLAPVLQQIYAGEEIKGSNDPNAILTRHMVANSPYFLIPALAIGIILGRRTPEGKTKSPETSDL